MAKRRFEMYQYRNIIARMRLGETDRALAKTGLIGRPKAKKIRHLAEQQGWLDPKNPLPENDVLQTFFSNKHTPVQQPQHSTSKIAPFKEEVTAWFRQGIQGTAIYANLVRRFEFKGSYYCVRDLLRRLKAEEPPRTTVILAFGPGECAQVDFGKGPEIIDHQTGEIFSSWIFVMTLGFSRHQYGEFVKNQKVATWLGCHRRAFEFFGGVPKKIIIDNAKCAITRACYYDPEVQRAYADLAEGYGFMIAPCPPHDPQKKGIVESGVKYVKNNFVPLREFNRGFSASNEALIGWVLETAGNRIHGTTRQKPLTLFTETEKAFLNPLPAIPPELASWNQVKLHGDCHIQFEKCRYSAPYTLVGKNLWLRSTESTVRLYHEYQLVSIHPHLTHPGQRHTLPEHLPPNAMAYFMRDPTWCREQARAVGEHCLQLVLCLFEDRVLDHLRSVQATLKLKDRFGSVRLNVACQRALTFNNPSYRTVKTILEKGLDYQVLPEQKAFEELSLSYLGHGKYSRNTQTLFH